MLSFSRKSIRLFSKYFTPTHEWIDIEGNTGTVGITEYAAHHLGDIVFVDVQNGTEVQAGQNLGELESVKATSPIVAPMGGKITDVNKELADNPAIINKSPESDGWVCKVQLSEPSNLGNLMNEASYKDFLKTVH